MRSVSGHWSFTAIGRKPLDRGHWQKEEKQSEGEKKRTLMSYTTRLSQRKVFEKPRND